MQEDSPGRREKCSINDRYSTPTQPKRLSASSAKQKARDYAAKDNKSTRVLAKQAILKELNTQLFIRAQGLSRTFLQEDDTSGNQVKNVAGSLKPSDSKRKELQETSTGSSRIPRRVGRTYTTAHRKRPLKPASQLRPVDNQQDALPRGKADEKFQETRTRFLAEKYVTLWKRKTYGRVDPTVARLRYKRNLKRYTLQVWQDIWWAGRRGWKLNIRAEYHNRYRLWQKVWKAWKEYMNYCKAKRGKEKSAVQQAQQTLLSRCWTGWIHYIRTRRIKIQENKEAMMLAEQQLKRRVWGYWLAQLVFRQDLRGMDHEALQFWAINVMSKAWRVWTFAWYAKDEERSKIAVASRFANQKQLLKVWRGWKNYRTVRKLRRLHKGAADRHFNRTVMRKSLNIWMVRWQRQVELAQFNDLILLKSDIALARRAFVHWKFYIVIRHKVTELKQAADHHYKFHLLRTCFNVLHLQAVKRRLKEMRKKMAADACQRFQLERAWSVWMKRCEHSEELKLHSLSRKARAHHSFQVKRKGVLCWLRYCHWRRSRKSQYAQAEFHFRVRALPRYFCRMMIFVDLIRLKKANELAAGKFRREALLAKMFYKWWSQYQLLMDIGMMERMAILHHDEVAKRRCLQFWRQRTRNELLEKKRELLSDNHRTHRLLLTAISRWREFNREMKECRSVHHSAVRHYYIRLLRKTWDAWQQFFHTRQIKWKKQARSGIHYQHKLLSRVLNTWKTYQRDLDCIKVHCEKRFREHDLARLRLAFKTWQLNAVNSREERKNRSAAKTFLHQTLLAKSFYFWREYAALRGVKKYEQSQRLHEIRLKLDRGKLSRLFGAWKSFTRKCIKDKQLRSRADCHYNKLLLHKALNSWKYFIHFCFRIKVLQRQSMWLHNRRITAGFLRKWKKQHRILLQEKEMTVLALWHWSLNLQNKVFFALMKYGIARKRKALRIAKALDDRRNRLLRAGVTQWMKVAFHLATERTKLAQTRQLEAAYSVHQCVYRCAMHWRRVAAKRIRQRGGKPKPRTTSVTTLNHDLLEDTVPAQPIPAVQPSPYPRNVDRILPEPFKERPRPRRPAYLRDSYDVAQISVTSIASKFTPSAPPRIQNLDDEAKPRSSPPLPVNQIRRNFHPLQRNPREESIVFPSSSGEESLLGQDKRRETEEIQPDLSKSPQPLTVATVKPALVQRSHIPLKASGGQRRPVLLPPSSFGLPSRTKRAPLKPSCPVGEEVRASGSTLPASTPRTSVDSQKRLASSPSSAASSRSGGNEQEAEGRDVTRQENENSFEESEYESSEEWEENQGKKKDEDERDEQGEKNSWQNGLWSKEGNLQERIFAMKNILQEFHDLKVKHSHKKQQRNQLSVWVRKQREELGPNHEDEELQETQQCLNDLTDEVQQLAERMKQTRPLVEEVAVRIRELIEKTGLT